MRKIVKQPSTAAEAATAPNTAPTIADDMLEGAEAIAAFLGFKRRQVFHIVKEGRLPVFHLGNKIFARKSTLVAHLAALEGAAQKSPASIRQKSLEQLHGLIECNPPFAEVGGHGNRADQSQQCRRAYRLHRLP
jgi:hypothetical protein